MKRLVWLLRRRTAELALWGGLALLLASLAAQWLAIGPLEDRVERLEGVAARRTPPAPGTEAATRAFGPRMQLASFYGHFERGDKLTTLLAKLHAVGRSKGLLLNRAEYRMNSPTDAKLDRYQVVMPIRGSYRALRAFIATALRELPTMSLDQVQFQRQEVGDEMVDAQLTFTFHLAR